MIVAAIDACGPSGSIALARVEPHSISVLAQTELAGKTYAAQLVPALRSLLESHTLTPHALDAIVIVNGPGSFTGVRIGVASAKGLAEALQIPLLAVSRLAVLAWKAGTADAALDAGRGDFYLRRAAHEALLSGADTASVAAPVAVCEPGAQRAFARAVLTEPPTAADALQFAAPRLLTEDFAAGDTADTVGTLDASYVRRPDAELLLRTPEKP